LKELDDQKKDNNALIEMTKHNLKEFLKIWCDTRPESNCSKVVEYLLYTEKEKNIYHTLNMLETN
jgi:phenylalanine-4-hydroxylase